jgi:hypothetical protein
MLLAGGLMAELRPGPWFEAWCGGAVELEAGASPVLMPDGGISSDF